jgi:hypothetical protein
VVSFDNLPCRFFIAKFLNVLGELIIEDIRKLFVEDERQDKVLELGRIGRAANSAGGIS